MYSYAHTHTYTYIVQYLEEALGVVQHHDAIS